MSHLVKFVLCKKTFEKMFENRAAFLSFVQLASATKNISDNKSINLERHRKNRFSTIFANRNSEPS